MCPLRPWRPIQATGVLLYCAHVPCWLVIGTVLWSLQSHGVWKSQEKSHSKLRAKRATFSFWVDKSSWKMVNFGKFLKIWSLHSNSVTRVVNFNITKIGWKWHNWKTQMRHFGWFSNIVDSLWAFRKLISKAWFIHAVFVRIYFLVAK